MLFQRLYNWIKYKTLPPSVLFKNRLFIERDSKHRRIFNNFGLTFRNSKWSNYEMYNVKIQFQLSYVRYLIWFIFFALIFTLVKNFDTYYVNFYAFNNVAFFVWLLIDAFDYYLSFLIWVVTLTTSLAINLVYSYFFFNNFSDKDEFKKYFSNSFFSVKKVTTASAFSQTLISKHDYSTILYAWLTNPRSDTSVTNLENIFNNQVTRQWWSTYYDFFIKLYKASYMCSLADEVRSTYYLNPITKGVINYSLGRNYDKTLTYLNNSSQLPKFAALTMSYFLNGYGNYFTQKLNNSPSLRAAQHRFDWNLANLSAELHSTAHLVTFKDGLFFLDNITFGDLLSYSNSYNELFATQLYVKNSINSAKWNRWLYRYSILHRKILKNSHKISITKKFLNSGVYSENAFMKNIWVSENVTKLGTNSGFINNLARAYYGDFLMPKRTSNYSPSHLTVGNNSSHTSNLKLISYYESSYFWFLKRFYTFNTLPNNLIRSSVKAVSVVKQDIIAASLDTNNALNQYFTTSSYALRANSLFFSPFINSHALLPMPIFRDTYAMTDTAISKLKDLGVFMSDTDLLTPDNLEILSWVTSSSLGKQSGLFTSSYLSTSTLYGNATSSFCNTGSGDFTYIGYLFLTAHTTTSNSYLSDLSYYSLFY